MFDNVIIFNICFIDAGTLSRVVYTYESVVMYVRDYTDWVVVFLFTMFLKYYDFFKFNMNEYLMEKSLTKGYST